MTRVYAWTIIAMCVTYDVFAVVTGGRTISETVRAIDVESGSLMRWAWLALYVHFFIPRPWGGWIS